MIKRWLAAHLLLAILAAAGCGSPAGSPAETAPAAPQQQEEPVPPASEPTVAAPVVDLPAADRPERKPGSPEIKEIAIVPGESWDDEWTVVPNDRIEVRVTEPGAREVVLQAFRYPSSPEVQPQQPDSRDGDVYTFHLEVHKLSRSLFLYVQARGEDETRAYAHHKIFAVNPTKHDFETVALGQASNWSQEKDAEVRELFGERGLLWFDDPADFHSFAARMQSLLGVTIPTPDVQGRTVLAFLRAPTAGERRFEVLRLSSEKPAADSLSSGLLEVDLGYGYGPVTDGPPTVAYHIIMTDLSAFKRPGTVNVALCGLPACGLPKIMHIEIGAAPANPVPATLTGKLQQVEAGDTAERAELLQSAAAELRAFLATPESRTLAEQKDAGLPGVRLLLSPADQMRVIVLDGGSLVGTVNRAHNYIQWWDGETQYLQELTGGALLVIDAAAIHTAAGERRLVLLNQLLLFPWTRSVAVYRLDPALNEWAVAPDSFAGADRQVGTTPVQATGATISVPARGIDAGVMFLRENGRLIEICNERRTACEVLTWDGTQYKEP